MFHTYVLIYSSLLHQIQSLIQSLKSNQDCTSCSVFLSSLPILFKALSVWKTCLVYQMTFDCSLAGSAGNFVAVAVTGSEMVNVLFLSMLTALWLGILKGLWLWALKILQLRVLCGLGLKVLRVHSWLIL